MRLAGVIALSLLAGIAAAETPRPATGDTERARHLGAFPPDAATGPSLGRGPRLRDKVEDPETGMSRPGTRLEAGRKSRATVQGCPDCGFDPPGEVGRSYHRAYPDYPWPCPPFPASGYRAAPAPDAAYPELPAGEGRVAMAGQLLVIVEPVAARVRVDGVPLAQQTDLSYAALLLPGRHHLEVSAPGHRSYAQTLEIAGGRALMLPVRLEPAGER